MSFPSICRNTPSELQMTELLSEGNLCVNFCGSRGQRVREFVDEFLGCDGNQTGSVRYLIAKPRNREVGETRV